MAAVGRLVRVHGLHLVYGPRPVVCLVVAILACGVGCGSPTAIERPAVVRPELKFGDFQRGRMRDGGIVFVEMMPIDWGYRLQAGEYLPITVTSRAGEAEDLRLRRTVCGLESGQSYACNFSP